MYSSRMETASKHLFQSGSLESNISGSAGLFLQDFQNNSVSQKSKGTAKLLLAMGIPLICLLTMSSIIVHNEKVLYNQVSETMKALGDSIQATDFISALQRERGVSALYISSPSVKVFNILTQMRQDTDDILFHLQESDFKIEFSIRIAGQEQKASLINLGLLIAIHRTDVNNERTNTVDNIVFYTTLIANFIDTVSYGIVLTVGEDLWKNFASIISFISTSDSAGVQRAIGSVYFSNCEIPEKGIDWMIELIVQENVHLKQAFLYPNDNKDYYKSLLYGDVELMTKIQGMKSEIRDDNYENCMNSTQEQKVDKALLWFDIMTEYIDILLFVIQKDIHLLVTTLNGMNKNIRTEFALIIPTIILVLIGCSVLSVWYVRSVNKMTDSFNTYAKSMSVKKKQISQEKRNTENLLYQLLPRHVADQLTQNKQVDAEYFSSVTIFFSDVVGFTSICSGLTPHQVVDLLSLLFYTFDSTIERHDVYKVETIGDAYMVASGLPQRNGILHARYISEMSLELSDALESLETPNGDKLQLRIGIHSGAVVAGVVGIKMPRYCLFGETVSIANAMEATGKACKIHITETTKDLLQKFGNFVIEYSGRVQIQGKGNIDTYWLLEGLQTEEEETWVQPFVKPEETKSEREMDTLR